MQLCRPPAGWALRQLVHRERRRVTPTSYKADTSPLMTYNSARACLSSQTWNTAPHPRPASATFCTMPSLFALSMSAHPHSASYYSESSDRSYCESKYPLSKSDVPIFISVVLTLFIIFLAVAIEVRTRLYADKPPREVPSPVCRATRFAGVSVAMIPMCIAFHIRVRQIQAASDDFCAGEIAVAPWPLVPLLLFNILPFVCACTVWLRTLVDCILVRFNKTVSDRYWTYALPISSVYRLVRFLIVLIRDGALRLMGASGSPVDAEARPHNQDVEMGRVSEDETQNLMQNQGSSTREDDEATVYSLQTPDEASVDCKSSPENYTKS